MNTSKGAVLVTGGTGYIGSQVVLALLDAGEHVVVIDDLSAGNSIVDLGEATVAEGNFGDAAFVGSLIDTYGIDTIFHIAAFIKVPESVQFPEKYFHNNVENTRTLIETGIAHGVKQVIFTSTGSLYGNAADKLLREDDPVNPLNPYAETKIEGEKIIMAHSGDRGPLRSIILRFFNAAGADPYMRTGYRIEERPTHITRVAVRAALENKEIQIFGTDYPTPDGTCVRDYVHVYDLAAAYMRALKYLREGGQTGLYNVGYGHGYSVLDIVEAVERVTGKTLQKKISERREGDPAILIADSSRLKNELGWVPKYDDIETIIRHEIAWVSRQTGEHL